MTQVRVLGSGDGFSHGARNQACILVETDGYRFLLDCGATSLVAMRRASIEPASIDAVFVSHFHGDHCGGVPYVILS